MYILHVLVSRDNIPHTIEMRTMVRLTMIPKAFLGTAEIRPFRLYIGPYSRVLIST